MGKEFDGVAGIEKHGKAALGQILCFFFGIAGLQQAVAQYGNTQGGDPVAQARVLCQYLVAQGAACFAVQVTTEQRRFAIQPGQQAAFCGGNHGVGFPQGIVQVEGQQLDHGSLALRLARGWARSYTWARCWKSRWVYTWVVLMSAWPSNS